MENYNQLKQVSQNLNLFLHVHKPKTNHLVTDKESQQQLEYDFDNLSIAKACNLAQQLVDINMPFMVYIIQDHDMK